ncbi:MAG: signal peptidase I [Rubrobacter sp.]|nr:signal peptidase I [Rubrobacter sp.]
MFGVVRPFVLELYLITSESMSPTLQAGDRVLAFKAAYRFTEPERGDLAVFRNGESGGESTIKRVVDLQGDTVAIRDGALFVNGEPRREPYVDYRLTDGNFFGPATVPEGHVFVMGDNRSNSLDSRFLGPIPEGDLLGEASFLLWPPDRISPVTP